MFYLSFPYLSARMFNKKSSDNSQRRMIPLRYVLMPIAIIFASAVVLIIVGAMAPKPAKKPIDVKAPLVEVQPLSQSTVTFAIASQGSIVPRTQTNLISEVAGQVVSVSDKFKVGGYFRKGELLLTIDDINYQVALVQAESRLGKAKASLVEEQARAKQAEDEWLLSGKSLDTAPVMALRTPFLQKADAELKAAQADLQQAKVKLSRTKIVAPYDAMIKEKNVDIGQYISTGSSMAVTFAIDYAEVRLPVKQRDVLFLDLPKIDQIGDEGSKVNLHVRVGGQKFSWSSKIARYEGVVDSQSRVHYVVAQIDDPYAILKENSQQELRIGTFVNAVIEGKTVNDVIAIPRNNVTGANTIFLLDNDNKLHIEDISILRTDADYIYTQDKFEKDRKLIITKLETPIENMTLRVKSEVVQDAVVTSGVSE